MDALSEAVKAALHASRAGNLIQFPPNMDVKQVCFSDAHIMATVWKHDEYEIRLSFWNVFPQAKQLLELWQKKNQTLTEMNEKAAFAHLENFLLHKYSDVLKKLKDMRKAQEKDFNKFLARDILEPLSGGYCFTNNDYNDLAIGYPDGYYGFIDMLHEPPEHLVILKDDDGTEDELVEIEMEDQGGSLLSPGGELPIEGKSATYKMTKSNQLSQQYATLLTFALIQRKRHTKSQMFPLLCISPDLFVILVYDTENDILAVFRIPLSKRASFILLWCVLNYRLFIAENLDSLKDYPCNFVKIKESQEAFTKDPVYRATQTELYSTLPSQENTILATTEFFLIPQ